MGGYIDQPMTSLGNIPSINDVLDLRAENKQLRIALEQAAMSDGASRFIAAAALDKLVSKTSITLDFTSLYSASSPLLPSYLADIVMELLTAACGKELPSDLYIGLRELRGQCLNAHGTWTSEGI